MDTMTGRLALRNFTLVAAAILAAFILGSGCTGAPDTSQSNGGAASTAGSAVDAVADAGDPGIFDDRIHFGQSAALSGPAQQLGTEFKLGIEAAFHEANGAGGIHGRSLELTSLDDSYEPDLAFDNTRRLTNVDKVFALVGEVGTPTSRSILPLTEIDGVPFVAPFTGAEFLRSPDLDNVVNLRASYYQETEAIVAHLTEELGLTRIAVMYQNDSFGAAGLTGSRLALERRGLSPVATWYYRRNTSAVKFALLNITAADPEALILIGAYTPVAEMITRAREHSDMVFATVSFVGTDALSEALGPGASGIYVTQVVPLPEDTGTPVIRAYQAALTDYDPDAVPGFVSLEGYLAGRLTIIGLEACGRELSRDCFLSFYSKPDPFDIDGFQLQYGPADNQGSDAVLLTVIGEDGKLRLVP